MQGALGKWLEWQGVTSEVQSWYKIIGVRRDATQDEIKHACALGLPN